MAHQEATIFFTLSSQLRVTKAYGDISSCWAAAVILIEICPSTKNDFYILTLTKYFKTILMPNFAELACY